MPIEIDESFVDWAVRLRPARTDFSRIVESYRVELAIEEAEKLEFEATKAALVELLEQYRAAT